MLQVLINHDLVLLIPFYSDSSLKFKYYLVTKSIKRRKVFLNILILQLAMAFRTQCYMWNEVIGAAQSAPINGNENLNKHEISLN